MIVFIISLGLIAYSLFSKTLQKTIITPPLVFVAFGLLVGPFVFHVSSFNVDHAFIHILAEITLVFVLFTDAARIDLKQLYRQHDIPIRLLAIGLPLTIIFGVFIGKMLLGSQFTWIDCAILSVILAPTDAALGQAVVSSLCVPVRIRQALNIESGLNDGIVLPLLLILISMAFTSEQGHSLSHWLGFVSVQLIASPLIGVAVGMIGGMCLRLANKKKSSTHAFQDISVLALALLAFVSSEMLHANGFIAVFCAGLTLGNYTRELCTCLYDFAEAEGQLLVLMTFLIFGAVLLPTLFHQLHWDIIIYAILSLTIIRMIPVAISLIGLKLRWQSILFLGWFGPRGLASILFGLLLLQKSQIPARHELMYVVITTVIMSIFAHGMSAYPFSQFYSKLFKRIKAQAPCECEEVNEMPTRLYKEPIK